MNNSKKTSPFGTRRQPNPLGKHCEITPMMLQILTKSKRSTLSKLSDILLLDPISRKIIQHSRFYIFNITEKIEFRNTPQSNPNPSKQDLAKQDILHRKIITSGIYSTTLLLYYLFNLSTHMILTTFATLSLFTFLYLYHKNERAYTTYLLNTPSSPRKTPTPSPHRT